MKRAEKAAVAAAERERVHTVADIDTGGGRQLYFSAPFFLPFSPAVVVQSKIKRKGERKVKVKANKVEHKCKVSE